MFYLPGILDCSLDINNALFVDFEEPLHNSADLGPLSILDESQILPIHKV